MLLFKSVLAIFPFFSPLLADINASYPPYHEEDQGGVSPMSSEARANCLAWLTLMDQGQYTATWDEAGSLLKDSVSRNEWVTAMRGLRCPLGYVSMRKIEYQKTLERLPYGTRGYFFEIVYSTTFWGKASARERCILMYNDMSNWVVTAYSIE